jgi:hypothetical protein
MRKSSFTSSVLVQPLFAALLGLACSQVAGAQSLHTFDGKYDISTIQLTAVYYVPKDRTPLPDWQERVNYFLHRLEAFHRRELDTQSALRISAPAEPFLSTKSVEELRKGDRDAIFFMTVADVRARLKWPDKKAGGFPILLVLSDINWRDLDDFRRLRRRNGRLEHEGAVASDGRHFPGADSGGARATYVAATGFGMGLVSADGWRVPYSGSDTVVYHEGIGHPIGLPHPDPLDDSVMGTAQYRYWLNETWINEKQKRALGWKPASVKRPGADLFSTFTAIPQPPVPAPGQDVALKFRWPDKAVIRSLQVRVQTDLFGPWHSLPAVANAKTPSKIPLGAFDRRTPVSYRVNATLDDGQQVELWGYFQVR